MIEGKVKRLRDVFVLVEPDAYYAYGSGWVCCKNDSGSLDGEWVMVDHDVVIEPQNFVKDKWAPEVHKYKGAYYMFTTYYSSLTNHRGCSVFKADSPVGPFVEITDGHVTPKDWDSIDGTLYIDDDGLPWMVFVHEWTSTQDSVGLMAIARMSDDLTRFVSEPVEIFRADSPPWTFRNVTDGPFLYRTQEGKLLMIWSNFDVDNEYCIGIAESDNGKIDGKWIHQEKMLYAKHMFGGYGGGHGMIFTDRDGTKYLSLHAPNGKIGDRYERPLFIKIREENGTIVCDPD